MSLINLKMVLEPDDDKWTPPVRYKKETADNVVAYWRTIVHKSTGKMPVYTGYAMLTQARKLLVNYSYKDVMRALGFMGTPKSKYYQYQFAIAKIEEGIRELEACKQAGNYKSHRGFVGPKQVTLIEPKSSNR